MTAEVCLMNTMGVALAADSAVTIGGARTPKIYNSADKLFLLSEQCPVGAMIYGNAALLEVPWETIVKSYRRQSTRPLSTVRAYADDFLAYLTAERAYFPAEVQKHAVQKHAHLTFEAIAEPVMARLQEHMKNSGSLTYSKAQSLLRRFLRVEASEWLREVKEHDLLATRSSKATLNRLYRPTIAKAESRVFQKVKLPPATRSLLHECVLEALQREMFSTASTGVVFAGFGTSEFFPSMAEITVDDVVANKVRWGQLRAENITHQKSALVIPFAQREMVYAFMEGLDPRLEDLLENVVEKLFRSLPSAAIPKIRGVPDAHIALVRKHLAEYVELVLPQLWTTLKRQRQIEFANPVASIVSHLPKDELGAMAAALVNLTSFRRRVTVDAETVGGPIDVAVITKGDGFVWIRRKHYFDPSFNPRQLAQYYGHGHGKAR